MKSLFELYREHQGKVSDKWSIYLSEYDRLFSSYRGQPVSVLEIGIQNGGSLEIWSKYFQNAKALIGCDINQNCAKLTYEDLRIKVVVGDADTDTAERAILANSPVFDIIVDDGSHTSRDIVKAFARYFRHLRNGGVFVAEDLHCSYWSNFEGGIYYPYSAISFFKCLADIINHEHWGVRKSRGDVLKGFSKQFGIVLDESLLAEIHAVEFFNSVCVVHKRSQESNLLGKRFIAGKSEIVAGGHTHLFGSRSEPQGQAGNSWSTMELAPSEDWSNVSRSLVERTAEISVCNAKVAVLNTQLSALNAQLSEQNEQLVQRDSHIQRLGQDIDALRASTSWRVTRPLRFVSRTFKQVRQFRQGSMTQPCQNGADQAMHTVIEPATAPSDIQQDAAFDALSGLRAAATQAPYLRDDSKLIAFYLPQYHRIEENSAWWGPGFTEWTNVVKAKPNYEGHYQPHLPREFGFYDLSNVDVMREQAEMAKLYGITGFCFYYYWFSGRRILEKPVANFLASDIDINYCLCWANENWTRTWDGNERSVLMHQKYTDADPLLFITELLPHFADQRYIRVQGKPLLLVYRAKDIPEVEKVFSIWRKKVVESGFPGLHIAVVDFYDISNPVEVGADALVEFPPHKFNGPQNMPDKIPEFSNRDFRGGVIEYAKVIAQSAARLRPDFDLYRCIIPSWDNTARRQSTPTIVHGSNPQLFGSWLEFLRSYTRETYASREDNFIFVNAWNEWGEGCHLEPDQKWGLAYLEALAKSAFYHADEGASPCAKNALLRTAAIAISSHRVCPPTEDISIEKTMGQLENHRPVGGLAQKIAFALRAHPLMYSGASWVYRMYRKVAG